MDKLMEYLVSDEKEDGSNYGCSQRKMRYKAIRKHFVPNCNGLYGG